jgi:hypothetical protein
LIAPRFGEFFVVLRVGGILWCVENVKVLGVVLDFFVEIWQNFMELKLVKIEIFEEVWVFSAEI